MKFRIVISTVICCLILFSCGNYKNDDNKNDSKIPKNIEITIQPFNDIDSSLINAVADSIFKFCSKVRIKSKWNLPEFAYYYPRNRYKADSILKYLSDNAESNEVVIGITTKDISTSKGDIADFGVMGLGRCPGNVCIASSFRLKKENIKSQLFKVAIHELGHTYGLPHCPNKSCFMRDAEGKNPTDEEKEFCENCKVYLKNKKWKFKN